MSLVSTQRKLVHVCSNVWSSQFVKNSVVDDRNEVSEIIENLVVVVRISSPLGRATYCPCYPEDRERREQHGKTHGCQEIDSVGEYAPHPLYCSISYLIASCSILLCHSFHSGGARTRRHDSQRRRPVITSINVK